MGDVEVVARLLPVIHLSKTSSFFDPKQDQPYAISADERFDSRAEAYAAWARQFGRIRGWVERNVGDSNDYTQMHENLLVVAGDYHPRDPNVILRSTEAAAQRVYDIKKQRIEAYMDDRDARYRQEQSQLDEQYTQRMKHAHSTAQREQIAHQYVEESKSRMQDAARDMIDHGTQEAHNLADDLAAKERKARADYRRSRGR